MFTIQLRLEKETAGAYRYQEIDASGAPVEQVWAKVGTLYVRKTALPRGAKAPTMVTLTVTEAA
jgi:hypothetical protein